MKTDKFSCTEEELDAGMNREALKLGPISRFPSCPECGHEVLLKAKAGRTRELFHGVHVPVPDDFEIPTCMACGEESMTPEISKKLDALLLSSLQAKFKPLLYKVKRAKRNLQEAESVLELAFENVQVELANLYGLEISELDLVFDEGYPCEKSPIGSCIYNDVEDPAHDECIICGEPEERK